MLLLCASVAVASDRFASPSGSGANPCTQAAPCDIVTAINGASANDDVTIEPGNYGPLSTTLTDNGNALTIHGQAGAPRPVINDGLVDFNGVGTSLSNVEIDTDASSRFVLAIGFSAAVTVNRVIVHALGTDEDACFFENIVTLTNSVCVADGSGPVSALEDEAGGQITLRNDTLEAPGGSGSTGGIALEVSSTEGLPTAALLTNVIARGAQADLLAQTDGDSSSAAVITADHSNYANVVLSNGGGGSTTSVSPAGSGTNETAAPKFLDPGTDDFHELAGSPTIGAGFSSPANGMSDIDGDPRQVGGVTDIGAYQFIPAPTCQPVTTSTGFAQTTSVQLDCSDILGATVSYAIVSNPGHGSVSLNASTGQATYTPAVGYFGPDSFTFTGTSSHGTSPAATVSVVVSSPLASGVTGGKLPAPHDSQPRLSPTTFAALPSGPSVLSRNANGGTIISYTDSQVATTTFVVRRPVGNGVLSHGKCVKSPHTGSHHGRSCTLYKTVGQFHETDIAGPNRLRFTGRVNGHELKPGRYQLLSTPTNTVGETGATHTNTFISKP